MVGGSNQICGINICCKIYKKINKIGVFCNYDVSEVCASCNSRTRVRKAILSPVPKLWTFATVFQYYIRYQFEISNLILRPLPNRGLLQLLDYVFYICDCIEKKYFRKNIIFMKIILKYEYNILMQCGTFINYI